MKKALFAGTFDPLTIGHEKIIEKCTNLFDSLVVALCINVEKKAFYSVEKRLKMIKAVCEKYSNVEVVYHEGYLVDLMKQKDITYTVRGVRNEKDYEYETKMHLVNKSLYSKVETLFIPCEKGLEDVSSTLVKDAIKNGENLDKLLSSTVIQIIAEN